MAAVRLIYLHYSTYRHTLLQTSISASTDRSVGKSKGTEFLMQFWAMFMAPGGQLEPFTLLPEIKNKKQINIDIIQFTTFSHSFQVYPLTLLPALITVLYSQFCSNRHSFQRLFDCLCEILSWYLRFFFGIYCQIKENLHQCMD